MADVQRQMLQFHEAIKLKRFDENDILRALRHGAAGSFNQVGQQAVGRSLNIPPTLTIRPGAPVRVMVTRDLILEPYRG